MSPIVTTIEGKIARIVLERPEKRNTLDTAMCREFEKQLIELNEDTRVRVIIICGQSNVFCAGLDIEEQLKGNKNVLDAFARVIHALDAATKPIIAAVNGPAVAQGVAMLYHCDLVYCGEHALFSMPFLALGQTPRYGTSLLAVKSAGYKLAAQKLLLSEPISASEAVAMGIVNHIVEDDKVIALANASALRLATLPPQALQASKRLLKAAYLNGMSEQMRLEEECATQLEGSAESLEAFNAFMEKRPPKFED